VIFTTVLVKLTNIRVLENLSLKRILRHKLAFYTHGGYVFKKAPLITKPRIIREHYLGKKHLLTQNERTFGY